MKVSKGHVSGCLPDMVLTHRSSPSQGSPSSEADGNDTAHCSRSVGYAPHVEPTAWNPQAPTQTPVGFAPRLGLGPREVPHPVPPVGCAPRVDKGTDQPPRTQSSRSVGHAPHVEPTAQIPQDPIPTPVGFAPAVETGPGEIPHPLPPVGSAPREDVGSRQSQALPREGLPLSQGVGPGLFAGPRSNRKRLGISATGGPQAKRAYPGPVSAVPVSPGVARGSRQDFPAREPDPVALLRQAADLMGFSLHTGGPESGSAGLDFNPDADVGARPVPAPDSHPEPRPRAPAALGAPPGEETFPVPAPPLDMDFDTESSFSGSVLSMEDPEAAIAEFRVGSQAEALLRKYLPQFYGVSQGDGTQTEPSDSLLFRSRPDTAQGIPLTADFQREYARVSKESKLRTPAALRKAYRFQHRDFEKFLAPETLSPEILRVADRRPQGNPLRGKYFADQDKCWMRVSELSRTSMRLSAYGGAISNLLAQADELRVTPEDKRTLHTVLLSLSEAMWSQASRTALYASRQRRVRALTAMGFPSRDTDQIARSIPQEGPYLFAGQAIQVFDDECAYRKRADETAAQFLQTRKAWGKGSGRTAPTASQPVRQVTVTVPGPAEPPAPRGRGRGKSSRGRRHDKSYRGVPKDGQGF